MVYAAENKRPLPARSLLDLHKLQVADYIINYTDDVIILETCIMRGFISLLILNQS